MGIFQILNPPIQAWALLHLFKKEQTDLGKGDYDYLEFCFLKLMNNFSWWVNKVDRLGNNIFEGGFLGLDNISILDRSKPLPNGEYFEQSDATGWMGFFSICMMRIALQLAEQKPLFERLAIVFFEHFLSITAAMQATKNRSIDLWDEHDGFFYDVVSYPGNGHEMIKVRSIVGLIPFFALDFFALDELQKYSHFYPKLLLYLQHYPQVAKRCITETENKGKKGYLFSLMAQNQMKRVLERVFTPEEFLSPYGLRSLSKYHEKHPVSYLGGTVAYEPGESLEKIKGGNSNWRGPIWMPINFLFIKSLSKLYEAMGDSFEITVSGKSSSLLEMKKMLQDKLISIYRRDPKGIRPVHGDYALFQENPHWRDLILFYEHYHGETGRGLGASHQTGWSGLVANLIEEE